MKTKLLSNVIAVCLAASAVAASGSSYATQRASIAIENPDDWAKDFPVKGWPVDADAFLAERKGSMGKAATDLATVFRPLTPCRIVDTRGLAGFVQTAGGPIAGTGAGTRRSISPATFGLCGIPSDAVGLSLAFAVRNNTPDSGGTLSFVAPGAPADAISAVFNFGTIWTTSNVIVPSTAGNFDLVVASANIDIAIDVNGYFEDLKDLDVGAQELDIIGNGVGSVLDVYQFGGGRAMGLDAPASSDAALRIRNGRIAVSGAGVDSDTTAFIHRTDATAAFGTGTGNLCNTTTFPDYSIIDHPMLNNNPDALIFITPNHSGTSSPNLSPFEAFYFAVSGGCTSPSVAGKWAIRDTDGDAMGTGDFYNILIIDN